MDKCQAKWPLYGLIKLTADNIWQKVRPVFREIGRSKIWMVTAFFSPFSIYTFAFRAWYLNSLHTSCSLRVYSDCTHGIHCLIKISFPHILLDYSPAHFFLRCWMLTSSTDTQKKICSHICKQWVWGYIASMSAVTFFPRVTNIPSQAECCLSLRVLL